MRASHLALSSCALLIHASHPRSSCAIAECASRALSTSCLLLIVRILRRARFSSCMLLIAHAPHRACFSLCALLIVRANFARFSCALMSTLHNARSSSFTVLIYLLCDSHTHKICHTLTVMYTKCALRYCNVRTMCITLPVCTLRRNVLHRIWRRFVGKLHDKKNWIFGNRSGTCQMRRKWSGAKKNILLNELYWKKLLFGNVQHNFQGDFQDWGITI